MDRIKRLEAKINKLTQERDSLLKDREFLNALLEIKTLNNSARHALKVAYKNDGVISHGLLKSKGMSRQKASQIIVWLFKNDLIVKYHGFEQLRIYVIKGYTPWIWNNEKESK